jgi:hypothetical protein
MGDFLNKMHKFIIEKIDCFFIRLEWYYGASVAAHISGFNPFFSIIMLTINERFLNSSHNLTRP